MEFHEFMRSKLKHYIDLVLEKNRVLNLTGATTEQEMWERHIQDSLELLNLEEVRAASTVLDLGSGAGMPGIPLAIVEPSKLITLMDATRKKVLALEEFLEKLELTHVRTIVGRAEELATQPLMKAQFECVVARAVAPLPRLITWSAPFVQAGGFFVAFKGSNPESELRDAEVTLKRLKITLKKTHYYRVSERDFSLLVFSFPDTTGRSRIELSQP